MGNILSFARGNSNNVDETEVTVYADNITRDLKLKLSTSIERVEIIVKKHLIHYNSLDKLTCDDPVFPSDYELAHMSSLAYNDVNDHKDLIKDWVLLTRASATNGYRGNVYFNADLNQIVIAHMGTNEKSLKDIWTDLKGIVWSKFASQMNSAITFTDMILSLIKKFNQDGAYLKLSLTGHSLGGWLAQVTTFSAKYLVKESESSNRILLVIETQIGYHAHCVVFESPGCKVMLERLKTEYVKYRYDHLSSSQISIDTLDITTYLSAPNRINCCNAHVGKLYRINFDFSDFNWLDENILHWLSTHGIKRLLMCFDPGTGQVWRDSQGKLKMQRVLNWPMIEGMIDTLSEYKIFYEWATKLNESESKTYHIEIDKQYVNGNVSIRYHTMEVDEKGFSLNVFNETENNFLEGYSYRQFVPKHESVIFSVDTDVHKDVLKSAIEKLDSVKFKIDEKNKLCLHGLNDKSTYLISYVKRLNQFFPNLNRVKWTVNDFTFDVIMAIYKAESKAYLSPNSTNSLQFDVDFLNLHQFLTRDNSRVLVQVEEDTSVGVLKIYKIFELVKTDTIYSDCNSLFLDATRMLLLQNHVNLASIIEKINEDYFIVIENNDDSESAQECLKELFVKAKKNQKIKVILVVNKETDVIWAGTVEDQEKSHHKGLQLSDLSSDSQNKILNSELINLQGHCVSLAQIIPVNLEPRNDLLKSIISTDVLMRLGNMEEIKVGSELTKLGEIKRYYIGRTLNKQENHFILKALNDIKNAIFTIAKTEVDVLAVIKISGALIVNYNQWVFARDSNIIQYIVLDAKNAENQYKDIREFYPDKHVHWLTRTKSGAHYTYYREQSRLCVTSLPTVTLQGEYKEDIKIQADDKMLLKDDRMLSIDDIRHSIVTVKGMPGMGKSTFFTHLALYKKRMYPFHWVVKLKLHTIQWDHLQKFERPFKKELVINFLSKILDLKSDFDKRLFEYCLCNEKVVLILDAFDEVSPKYDDQIFGLLETLQTEMKVKQLWVSSRPYALKDERLNKAVYTLQAFNEKDQKKFFQMFWEYKLTVNFNSRKCEAFASKVLNNMPLDVFRRSMAGNPLILNVMAECYLNDFEKYCNYGILTQILNSVIHEVYEKIIDRNINILFSEKLATDTKNQATDIVSKKKRKTTVAEHQLLALVSCGLESIVTERRNEINQLIDGINKGEEITGFISGVVNVTPHFIHATFAEYFAAVWLIEQMIPAEDDERFIKLFESLCDLLKRESRVVLSLFNSQLSDNNGFLKEKLSKCLQQNKHLIEILRKVSENDLNIIRFLINLDFANGVEFHSRSDELIVNGVKMEETKTVEYFSCHKYGKACNYASIILDNKLLFIAAQTNISGSMTSFLLSKVSREKLKEVVNKQDRYSDTALHVAVRSNRLEVAMALMQNGADLFLRNQAHSTALDLAIECENSEFPDMLLCNSVPDSPLGVVLHFTCRHLRESKSRLFFMNFIQRCFEQSPGSSTSAVDQPGQSQLSVVVRSPSDFMIKVLTSLGAEEASDINYDLTSLLHSEHPVFDVSDITNAASLYKGSEKLLIALIANIALKYPNYLIGLFSARDGIGNKLLHTAAKLGYVAAAELTIGLGADVDITNNKGETAMSVAAKYRNYSFILWISCRNNAEANKKEDLRRLNKFTRDQFFKFIDKHLSDDSRLLTKRYDGGDTLLHIAAGLDIVKLANILIDRGADVNVRNEDNHTPLSLACKNGHLEIMKLLIDKGASISHDQQSPLLWAIYCGHYEIVEFLVKNGADLNAKCAFSLDTDCKSMWTPLHLLVNRCLLTTACDETHNERQTMISKCEGTGFMGLGQFRFQFKISFADLIVLFMMYGLDTYTTNIEDVSFVTYLEDHFKDDPNIRRLVLLFHQCNSHEQLLTTIQSCDEGIRVRFKQQIEMKIPEFYNIINACKAKDIRKIQQHLNAVLAIKETLCGLFSDIEKSISSEFPYIFPYRSNWATVLVEYLYFIAVSFRPLFERVSWLQHDFDSDEMLFNLRSLLHHLCQWLNCDPPSVR